eukprot:6511050-Pyramimonas_sp.AAC.1
MSPDAPAAGAATMKAAPASLESSQAAADTTAESTTPAPPTPALLTPAPSTPPPTPADSIGRPFGAALEEAVKGPNSVGFDWARLRNLQLADPYSGPLLIGLE